LVSPFRGEGQSGQNSMGRVARPRPA
jgi:hypothetical protein